MREDTSYSKLEALLHEVGVEFHKDLIDLLNWFSSEEKQRFVDQWARVESRMRTAFIAFILGDGEPNEDFLVYLNREVGCQEAVDLAFAAHIRSLNDFSRALMKAEELWDESQPSGNCEGEDEGDGGDEASLETVAQTGGVLKQRVLPTGA